MPFFAAGSLVLCTLTAICSVGPATPPSTLTLTLHAAGGPARSVQLTCHPDTGTHPQPARACSALDAADGDFERLPADTEATCTLVYSPVRAEARGRWKGERVDFTTEYANACQAEAQSGGVFGF